MLNDIHTIVDFSGEFFVDLDGCEGFLDAFSLFFTYFEGTTLSE
jgi:hypothetical protein